MGFKSLPTIGRLFTRPLFCAPIEIIHDPLKIPANDTDFYIVLFTNSKINHQISRKFLIIISLPMAVILTAINKVGIVLFNFRINNT